MNVVRAVVIVAGLILIWQIVIWATAMPPFMLPTPWRVAETMVERWDTLAFHAGHTILEIILGLLLGALLGCATALTMSFYRPARRWLLPIMVTSQAIPVFALAPILVLWFGYGLWSKVAMATLIIYFPVTAAFYDGLRRTEPGWLDLARTMNAPRAAILRRIRIPAALPALASGLRVAAAIAPIGAIVGEWVGASAGLGYVMMHAKGRSQEPLMFAALVVLAIVGIALYFSLDALLRRMLPWQPDTQPSDD
ncbi:MAG: ABC transporter permease [Alphaproteobacteria bacterium]